MKFAFGADIGWAGQLESMGYYWSDSQGNQRNLFDILKDNGIDSVRFRIFNNPPANGFWDKTPTERCMLGFCDVDSIIHMSKRAQDYGFRIMLDFHYSDFFADPQYQITPIAWEKHTIEEKALDVHDYTVSVLKRFRDAEIKPEWIQVGNEINPGMMLPSGDALGSMDVLVKYLNAGYEAVKEVFEDTLVITHLASGAVKNWITDWFDSFFAGGGKTDIIGLSHYPYWNTMVENAVMTDLGDNMIDYYSKYGKPVMVVEVGEDEEEPQKTYDLIKKTISDLKRIPDGNGVGLFYWEPEISKDALPDKYPLGACRLIGEKELRFTDAISAFIN